MLRRSLEETLQGRRESGEIGRRAGLRIQWGNPWGFDSPLSHHIEIQSLSEYTTGDSSTPQTRRNVLLVDNPVAIEHRARHVPGDLHGGSVSSPRPPIRS